MNLLTHLLTVLYSFIYMETVNHHTHDVICDNKARNRDIVNRENIPYVRRMGNIKEL